MVDDYFDFEGLEKSAYTIVEDMLILSVYYDHDVKILINGGDSEEVTEDDLYDVKATPSSFVKNTKDEVIFTINAAYLLFTGVLVNGKKLDSKHYTSKEGYTIVVLNNAYLNSLEVGTYKVDFEFEEGSAISTFTVTKAVVKEKVPKTNDNKYYLDHSLDKSKNKNGWIFLDYRNNFNKDKNTIIYGHNMRDNTMFGTLKNLLKEDYLNDKDNQDIKIYTDNYIYTYEVFSVYRIETTNDYIEVSFVTNDNFIDLVNLVTKRSIYDFKKEVLKEDKILTLSTCSGDLNKLVVHGVLRGINHYES